MILSCCQCSYLRFWGNRKSSQGSAVCHVQMMKLTILTMLIFYALNVVLNLVDLGAVQVLHTCRVMDVEE
jgi:hypothetical protein